LISEFRHPEVLVQRASKDVRPGRWPSPFETRYALLRVTVMEKHAAFQTAAEIPLKTL